MPHYAILGLSSDAKPEDIKRAYRRLAMRWHPDRNAHPESTERFKQIRAAYEALANQQAAAQEDDSVENPPSTAEVVRAADIRLSLEISLAEAFSGCVKTINYQRGRACKTCDGSGEHGISRTRFCRECHGSGRLRDKSSGLVSCHHCDGRGFFIERICPDCGGSGRDTADVSLEIKIPSGMMSGDDLRLAGQGEPGGDEIQPGDLFLTILIEAHPLFQLNGRNLYLEMPVNAFLLLAGGQINAPLPVGTLSVKLDSGDISTRQLRISGKGYPGRKNIEAGDFYLTLKPVFPKQLTAKQNKLLQQITASIDADSAAHLPEIADWWTNFRAGDAD
jgi:molecular chaperone DnaJ